MTRKQDSILKGKKSNSMSPFAQWSLVLLITIGLFEGLIEILLSYPALIPESALSLFRSYHRGYELQVPHLHPSCSEYDPLLTYRLRRGQECQFNSREFQTTISINSFGVRDDEASLSEPSVLVLGDSYAMGWGVEDREAFPSLIEKETGFKVLNTGISSYGTARQVELFKQVDRRKLRWLVLQYCDNDFNENKIALEQGKPKILEQNLYQMIVKYTKDRKKYYPAKHTYSLIKSAIYKNDTNFLSTTEQLKNPPNQHAEVWYKTVEPMLESLNNVGVIVVPLGAYRDTTSTIATAFIRMRDEAPAGSALSRIHILDGGRLVSEDDYFILDSHIKASGHRKLAKAINDIISDHEPIDAH